VSGISARRYLSARKALLGGLAIAGLVVAWVGWTPVASAAGVFNVRDFGARGDGSNNDTPAINRAITAANGAGGGTVLFPPGTYRAGASIHLKSDVTLQLGSGATITGASSGYDAPEPNPSSAFQDFGHSHFHDAMIWGDGVTNIGFTGSGTIDGNGNLVTGTPSSGEADKIISITHCDGLTINGIRLRRGGHFAMLINGCTNVRSDRLAIDTPNDRDGWNIVNTTNVTITNITITSDDDALSFKSDWALGATLPNGHVTVVNAQLSAEDGNALMFGSETCGDFTDYQLSHITVSHAGKSGLGMVSMDGATISHVRYNDIHMSGTASPIMQKIGTRRRCGDSPGIGGISDIRYTNVTGTNAGAFTPTLWGQPGRNVTDVVFENVNLTLPGGNAPMATGVPTDNGGFDPGSIGTRPAYGWYLHNVSGVAFTNSSVRFSADDGRPAVIASTGSSVSIENVIAQRGTNSPFDVGFQTIAGYCVTSSANTEGGGLRLDTTGSTEACTPGNDFSLTTSPAARSVQAGSSTTYTVSTSVVTGAPGEIELSANGLPAGAIASFSPNPIPAGATSLMTISTETATPGGAFAPIVTGTGVTGTHTDAVALTVSPVPLALADLVVADPANAGDWSVQANLHSGVTQYGDRSYTVTSVPAALVGAAWIRSANDSKSAPADPLVTFTINRPAIVYVAVDTRLGRRPWMDVSWADTQAELVNGESTARHFTVFAKSFPAGPVALGPNADPDNGSSMYTVIVT